MKEVSQQTLDEITRLDIAYLQSTVEVFVGALRSGKGLPNVSRMRLDLYRIARSFHGLNDKGAKAWASAKLEEAKRRAFANVESQG